MLGRIWNLADTHQRGELGLTEFMIAMHLLASYRNGTLRALPQLLPAGLYEAASRRGGPGPRLITGSRPSSGVASISPVNRQFSGSGFSTTSNSGIKPTTQQPQPPPGDDWAIGTREKETFDQVFSTLDTENRGYITGEQAVGFFSNSRLPEEVLAQIWDLADIHSEGRLNRDEFAVAMFLIRQERTKRDPRDTLPQKLPPNLMPPSMRPAPPTASHPTVPLSDPAPVITTQKSAADDLVGLDAPTSSDPQVSSSPRDQQLYSPPPFIVQGLTSAYQTPQPSSSFEPFVPPVSFDQAMRAPTSSASPQTAGFPNLDRPVRSESLQQKSAMDDLLGDNDPEISKKLTQETADLANLSNQVSNLTSQMQQVKAKRISTEQDLSKAQTQKRDFEVRLTQLRSAYEQENLVVTALGERLSLSKNELRTLEQDMAQIHLTHQNLQAQHKELAAVLEADRKENAAIKERIRQTNVEVDLLRPQLEKLKSDARQQKGLVAINKKQLATNEIERVRIKREIDTASSELEEATREAEESALKLRGGPEADGLRTPSLDPIANRPSPATNMNPFLRRPPTELSEQGDSSAFTASKMNSPNHTAFDNFFGPPANHPQAGPPVTSFSVRSPVLSDDQPSTPAVPTKLPEGQITISPSDPALSSAEIDTPHIPPAPPRSRQITSSFLPLRNLHRSDSTSSSVVVAPPGSRAGGASGSQTPTDLRLPNMGSPRQLDLKQKLESQVIQPRHDEPQSSSDITDEISSPHSQIGIAKNQSTENDQSQVFGHPSTILEVPGAFPGDNITKSSSQLSRSNSSKSAEDHARPSATQLLNSSAQAPYQERTSSSSKDDFSAAFEGFGDKGKGVAKTNGNAFDGIGRIGSSNANGEFPPIEEIRSNDDSDSESDYGFDDDFTKTSPQRPPIVLDTPAQLPDQSTKESTLPSDPSLNTTRSPDPIQSPIPVTQPTSPISNQVVALPGPSSDQDSKHFPIEHVGLLSSQSTNTSHPASSAENTTFKSTRSPKSEGEGLGLFADRIKGDVDSGSNILPSDSTISPVPSSAPYSPDQGPPKQFQPQPVVPPKSAHNDDFEKEFGDLAEAKEADDKGEDDVILTGKDTFDDFNPVFDSPTPSKTTINPPGNSIPVDNGFHDFELSNTGYGAPSGPQNATNQANSQSNHDWDALFAGLDKFENKSAAPAFQSTGHFFDTPTQPQQLPSSSEVNKPVLHRGLSTGTEHDDPILKRLTGMGYPRDASLSALEKFDYNIDKVRSALRECSQKFQANRFSG